MRRFAGVFAAAVFLAFLVFLGSKGLQSNWRLEGSGQLVSPHIKVVKRGPGGRVLWWGPIPEKLEPKDWRLELTLQRQEASGLLSLHADVPDFDVEILLASEPTRVFLGKLQRSDLAEAIETSTGPVVVTLVRLHPLKGDIPPSLQVPAEMMRIGVDAQARVCSPRSKLTQLHTP
jgi:hypothetical protein